MEDDRGTVSEFYDESVYANIDARPTTTTQTPLHATEATTFPLQMTAATPIGPPTQVGPSDACSQYSMTPLLAGTAPTTSLDNAAEALWNL